MKNMQTVLLLGSGALKIGEAGEFDYSGTQAIKALKEEGKRVILVNPNIATIQTSEDLADEIYFLPVTAEFVTRVIEKEKPDGILLSFGGQTALNCGMALHKAGVLKKYGVEILGTPIDAIIATEDRQEFSARLDKLGLSTAKGKIVSSMSEAVAFATSLGFPVMVRAGFALGGTGSGVARTKPDLEKLLERTFASTSQVIIEESLFGWKELEYEVVRDINDNCITVCNMENFDPVGIHTGESIVVAPSQTLNSHEYFMLRQAAIDVIRHLGIVGECNIQFALDPKSLKFRIIEVNARLSRSSALASKATGYPLAYVAAKLALGKTLPEIPNSVTKETTAFFEPALDYVVVKIPRWDLEKFSGVVPTIGSEMKSVGEVMAIGKTFEEAIQKGIRMLNIGRDGAMDPALKSLPDPVLTTMLRHPTPKRIFAVTEALTRGVTIDAVHRITAIDRWFLSKLANVVETAKRIEVARPLTAPLLVKAKKDGFSDSAIGRIRKTNEDSIRALRKKYTIRPFTKRIDTMAGEFPAVTSYLYMTYHADTDDYVPLEEKKAIVLGCGPYAIGTSVEFDWCAVNTSLALRENGVKSIMVNCNPETVSTDFDMSDYLYFEELTVERVRDICEREGAPVIVSVGGQIPNNMALRLEAHGIPLLGTPAKRIYEAEHRKTFSKLLDKLEIVQPAWQQASSSADITRFVAKHKYPVLVRPSFVLSGKGMSVIVSDGQLEAYMRSIDFSLKEYPLVVSKYYGDATECDVDGVSQNGKILVTAISEHVEGAGVHSGDSTLLYPTVTFSPSLKKQLLAITASIVKALEVSGPWNIQFLIDKDTPYVIECNLRASRSFPFVSKVSGVNFISVATNVMLGNETKKMSAVEPSFQAIKAPQFSFHKLRGSDPVLRVEMGSTGEVCALGMSVHDAYYKAIMATGVGFPSKKAVFLSLGGVTKKLEFLGSAQALAKHGFVIYATSGTSLFLKENGIEVRPVRKMYEGAGETAMDLIGNKLIDFAVLIPEETNARPELVTKGLSDGYYMRRRAVDMGIPIFTNTQTAQIYVESITSFTSESVSVLSLGEYRKKGSHI